MNRQQRRQAQRQMEKDQTTFRKTITDPAERTKNGPVMRQTWYEAQVYNNHEWGVRLERIKAIKGIGPVLMSRIFEVLEEPLTTAERQKARQQYENGVESVDFRNQETIKPD